MDNDNKFYLAIEYLAGITILFFVGIFGLIALALTSFLGIFFYAFDSLIKLFKKDNTSKFS